MTESGPYVLAFDQIADTDRDIVGSKALALAELRQAGFSVPDGFCITTLALRSVMVQAGLTNVLYRAQGARPLSQRGEEIRTVVCSAPLPDHVLAAIRAAYERLGHGPVAVRSSALQEDQPEASFAGQYDTYLNVHGLAATVDAIRACWSSLWNERAIAYRMRQPESGEAVMAVIVQRQIPARASGLLFTLDPLTGREEHMVVEASWGLGEGIVSGKITPDRFVVDAWNGSVIERHVADKKVLFIPGATSGVQEAIVPPEEQKRPVLSDADARRLAELGLQIQEMYGRPQDIEWALHDGQFYILQARPLTSYTFAADIGQWTSANFREIMPGLVNPLSFSVNLDYEWGRAMDEFFTRMRMQPDACPVVWSRTFFGRAYWNVGEVKRRAALVPGFRERSFDVTVGIKPTYSGDGYVTPVNLRTLLRGLPILVALNRLYATIWRDADAEKRAFLSQERDLLSLTPQSLSDDALVTQVRRVLDLHVRVNRLAMLVSFLSTQAEDDFHQTMEGLNKGLAAADQVPMGDLLTGLGNVSTARPLLDLWEISHHGAQNPVIADIIRQSPAHELLHRLEARPDGQAFVAQLRSFLERYAYMASGDEDLSAPRWIEEPAFVLHTLKSFVQGGHSESPAALLSKQQATRRRARERVRQILDRSLVNRLLPVRKRMFLSQMLLLHRYCWWREEMRDVLARAHYQCHRFLVELGRRWAACGLTDDPGDVFYLTRDQFLAVLAGELDRQDARRLIARHRRVLACYRHFDPPVTIGPGMQTAQQPSRLTTQSLHKGIACSPGRATGPARILNYLDEARRLQRGDILVAPYVNPGWTPLFSVCAAIVVEEGGLLSHGAVIARECGVPAVLRIEHATQIFRDGQMLRVDGGQGTVEIV